MRLPVELRFFTNVITEQMRALRTTTVCPLPCTLPRVRARNFVELGSQFSEKTCFQPFCQHVPDNVQGSVTHWWLALYLASQKMQRASAKMHGKVSAQRASPVQPHSSATGTANKNETIEYTTLHNAPGLSLLAHTTCVRLAQTNYD